MAIVPHLIRGEHGEATLSSMYAAAVDACAFRPELAVMSLDELPPDSVLRCGADRACMSAALAGAGAAVAIIVVANALTAPPVVSVIVLAPGTRESLGESIAALAPGEPTIEAAIRSRASALLDRAGFEAAGRLRLDVSPRGAQISIDGAASAVSSELLLAPGPHRVTAYLEGFEPQSADVELRAGEERSLALHLQAEQPLHASPWFWAAAIALAAGATLAIAVLAGPTDRCFCVARDGATCDGC